jgi:hypothetical protein
MVKANSRLPGLTAEAALKSTQQRYAAAFRPADGAVIRAAGLYHPPSPACLRACYRYCYADDICDQCETICSGGVLQ